MKQQQEVLEEAEAYEEKEVSYVEDLKWLIDYYEKLVSDSSKQKTQETSTNITDQEEEVTETFCKNFNSSSQNQPDEQPSPEELEPDLEPTEWIEDPEVILKSKVHF